jgi:hypothetical protein
MGQIEAALDWIERAARRGCPLRTIADDPDLAAMANHPRFLALVGRRQPAAPPSREPLIGVYLNDGPSVL